MTLFRQRVSDFQIEGLPPSFDKDGEPLPVVLSDAISIKAGEVVLTVKLSQDKKSLEVVYAAKSGKAHDHKTMSGRDGVSLQVAL